MNTSLYTPFDVLIVAVTETLMPFGFDTTKNQLEVDSLEKIQAIYNKTGRVKVWSGASDTSIFQSADVNEAFRAWHDYVHITHDLPFTLDGEIKVCRIQQEYIRDKNIDATVKAVSLRLLEIEVIEQVKYFFDTGKYVKDQRQFTVDKLLHRV